MKQSFFGHFIGNRRIAFQSKNTIPIDHFGRNQQPTRQMSFLCISSSRRWKPIQFTVKTNFTLFLILIKLIYTIVRQTLYQARGQSCQYVCTSGAHFSHRSKKKKKNTPAKIKKILWFYYDVILHALSMRFVNSNADIVRL